LPRAKNGLRATFGPFFIGSLVFARQDKAGCKDHPLFARTPNTYMAVCMTTEYDEVDFYEPPELKPPPGVAS